MTWTIEIIEEDALKELKALAEKKSILMLPGKEEGLGSANEPALQTKNLMSDEKRKDILRSLYGAIPFDEKRYKEQMEFLHQIRNEWE